MLDTKWINRFLKLAEHISEWSKDSTKVGAVIVDKHKRVVSLGYNGFPRKIEDKEEFYLNREIKLKYIVHAEENAILNAQQNLAGCYIFIYPYFPCNECAKLIVQSGITHVFCKTDNSDKWRESFEVSKEMFGQADIKYFILNGS